MWKHIESYIENNREELDQHTPPSHLWDRIEAKLDTPVPMRRKAMSFDNWVRLAAAIILVLGGAWVWIQFSPKQQLPSSSILPAIHQLHEASPEWNEAEAIYQQELNQMLSDAGLQTWQDSPAYVELKPALDQVTAELEKIHEAYQRGFGRDSLLEVLKEQHELHLGLLKGLVASGK